MNDGNEVMNNGLLFFQCIDNQFIKTPKRILYEH